jgi:hypothetical protein
MVIRKNGPKSSQTVRSQPVIRVQVHPGSWLCALDAGRTWLIKHNETTFFRMILLSLIHELGSSFRIMTLTMLTLWVIVRI